MKIVILLVSAACFILAVNKNRSISNPYVAFNALWMVVAALSNKGNKFVYEPNFCLAMIYMRMIIKKVSMGMVLLGLIHSSICRWCFSSRKKEYVRSHMYSTWLVGGAVQ